MIDLYVLGHGIRQIYPLIVLAVSAIGVMAAQNRIYASKVRELERKVTELTTQREEMVKLFLGPDFTDPERFHARAETIRQLHAEKTMQGGK